MYGYIPMYFEYKVMNKNDCCQYTYIKLFQKRKENMKRGNVFFTIIHKKNYKINFRLGVPFSSQNLSKIFLYPEKKKILNLTIR